MGFGSQAVTKLYMRGTRVLEVRLGGLVNAATQEINLRDTWYGIVPKKAYFRTNDCPTLEKVYCMGTHVSGGCE